jgi:prophage regulatory protein
MSMQPRMAQEKQDNQKHIIRLRQVLEQVSLSRATVYKMIRRSEFPQPVQIGQRSVGWLTEEVNTWLESRPHTPPGTRAAAPE